MSICPEKNHSLEFVCHFSCRNTKLCWRFHLARHWTASVNDDCTACQIVNGPRHMYGRYSKQIGRGIDHRPVGGIPRENAVRKCNSNAKHDLMDDRWRIKTFNVARVLASPEWTSTRLLCPMHRWVDRIFYSSAARALPPSIPSK